jgi:hypothetical protein
MRAKDFTTNHEHEADYGPKYQAMGKRVGGKARAQENAKQQQQPKKEVSEAPGAETLAHNQNTVTSNEKAFDLEEYVDPELAPILSYASTHYPNYKKKPEAFMKWASRAIKHSEEADSTHDQAIASISSELEELKRIIEKLSRRK